MVYCGKPSKGCQMCRTRRIKCDETKPTCNQCAKSRRQCPGYKDEFDLVFRNETQATERRARRGSKKALIQKTEKSESPTGGITVSPVFSNSIKSPIEQTVIPSLNMPIEHQANCHFVSNFVLVPKEGGTRGFMDFVIPLLNQDPHNHLQHAFDACSIALLNNRGGTGGKLADKAIYEYTKALNGTNAALRNPEMQLADSTLAAVLLLGLFESITAKQIGMLNWGSHTEGAIQLVKARGKKQLKNTVGLPLFIAVRTQMIIHSLTSGTTPVMGEEWWINDAVRDVTAAKCHRLLIKTGELRAEVTRLMNSMPRTPDNMEIMLDMIRKLQTVDQELVSWMRNVPEEWRFQTIAWEDHVPNGDYSKAEVFPGRIDMYQDFYISSVWNTSRTARLVLASLVVRCAAWVCTPVDYRTTPEYATAARTCVDTITDIIASVPCNLGWHLRNKHRIRKMTPPSSFSSLNPNLGFADNPKKKTCEFACGEEQSVKSLAGYFMTWPLVCLNSQDYTTDAQRAWIQGRLSYIGDELGVRHAHTLKQVQVRMPSMLIRRDGLMANPLGPAYDYMHMMTSVRRRSRGYEVGDSSVQFAPQLPPALNAGVFVGQQQQQQLSMMSGGVGVSPLQHVEAMHKERFEQHRAELLARAAGGQNAGEGTKWIAQRWLVV